jgi:hypothetical protein
MTNHLGRKSLLVHKHGSRLQTPMLVPSFSSKGFLIDDRGRSELYKAFSTLTSFLTDVMLVSAYDIVYKLIPAPASLTKIPGLTIVDSGGYEIADDHDLQSVLRHPVKPKKWTSNMLIKALRHWPKRSAAMFVNFDHPARRGPFQRQVEEARLLFSEFPEHLHCFLIKPEKKTDRDLAKVFPKITIHAKDLSAFDVIGVTEKELGSSILDRMEKIAQLRFTLDDAGVKSPIHVFGALDPLSAMLYFLSGAEIFDGLTWLRYGYEDDRCIYRSNYGAIQIGIAASETKINEQMTTRNILYLQKLEQRLRNFLLDGDFSNFGPYHKVAQEALDSLRSRLGGRL